MTDPLNSAFLDWNDARMQLSLSRSLILSLPTAGGADQAAGARGACGRAAVGVAERRRAAGGHAVLAGHGGGLRHAAAADAAAGRRAGSRGRAGVAGELRGGEGDTVGGDGEGDTTGETVRETQQERR
jgi:hypothetical protein